MDHECSKVKEITEATESTKSAHLRLNGHDASISALTDKVGTIEVTTSTIEVILDRLDKTVTRLDNAISKALWAITGSIIIAAIYAALNIK